MDIHAHMLHIKKISGRHTGLGAHIFCDLLHGLSSKEYTHQLVRNGRGVS